MSLPQRIIPVVSVLTLAGRDSPHEFTRTWEAVDGLLRDQYQIKTLRKYYTLIRKQLAVTFDGLPACAEMLSMVKLSDEEYAEMNLQYERSLKAKRTNKHILHQAHIGTACSLAKSRCIPERTLGLMILTGRRPIELLHCGSIARLKESNMVAMFSGHAKRKWNSHLPPYAIPLLAPFPLVHKSFVGLRKLLGNRFAHATSNDTITRSIDLSHYCHEYFGEDVRPYDFRHWYAAICEHLYRPSTVDEKIFIGAILGHRDNEGIVEDYTARAYSTTVAQLSLDPDPAVWPVVAKHL